ncbi:thiamine/thiamine pyrophosphate ABC transporter permease ThiP [Aliivibrio fischeri]|uniref:thiamine/thiamine pyrophosphate ABC transporter permease ThiP n=1 Tax=Aliivibrio fischeri TaxID=668 RepID=UPI0012DADEAA|nr:thiamine/thiamine pyrophosphate ABC transporter permease ThiP [Aliivibrio fischeri]MUJ23262.1 thiamine/thiamine pyrophosphate ABC transporter permease ThiP [Aliivibrio fischeri]
MKSRTLFNSTPFIGYIVAATILCFVGGAISALLIESPSLDLRIIWSDPYYRYITQFSLYQAFSSTIISVGLAIPTAYALSRRQFIGRGLLLKLCATTLVLPVLVGVFGLLAIYGNSGLIADAFAWFGSSLPFSIYGLNGILLAHVFFNFPFATRLLLQSLDSISIEQHQLSAHLGLMGWSKYRLVAWPRIKQQLPHVAGLVFMLCFTSFATVMALGGSPKSTTIELAIYQAIKFDFDLQSGAILALWQMLLCGLLSLCIQRFSKSVSVDSASLSQVVLYQDTNRARWWDWAWITVLGIFMLPPLFMVVLSGLNSQLFVVITSSEFWSALINSLIVAFGAAVIALLLGVLLLHTTRSLRLKQKRLLADKLDLIGVMILVTPGLVISTGLFLLLRNITDVFSIAIWIVILVNALMALPYVIKTLAQPLLHIAQQYHLLCASLGVYGLSRFRVIEWKALRKPFAHAFSIAFIMSVGDLSAIALFGSQDFRTLPLYLFQLLGSYQMEAAAVISLSLLLLSVGVFAIVEWLFLSKKRKQ